MKNYLDKFKIDKNISIVTGGSGGIGKEVCKALIDGGSYVILVDKNTDISEKFIKKINSKYKKNKIEYFYMDSTSVKEIQKLSKYVKQKFNKIDTLVNCIGICKNKNAENVNKDEWDDVISINLNSMFYICREIGKIFIKQKKGNIINIGSNSGLIVDKPQPQASYNASKAGVHQLTKSLACEWANYNIRVNAIAPGYVATKMTLLGRKKPKWFKLWLEMTPMKRLAKPSEIASVVLFLASESSSYCTGSIISVDGGYTSW